MAKKQKRNSKEGNIAKYISLKERIKPQKQILSLLIVVISLLLVIITA